MQKMSAIPTVQLDTREARRPWFSIQDAQARNLANQGRHSAANQQRAQEMREQLDKLYTHQGVFVNYRQKFISVKVNHAQAKSMFDLTKQELTWMRQGVSRAVTQQGVIYRIPRA
jgi:hypothetical protein